MFKKRIKDSGKKPAGDWQWHHIVNQNPTNVKAFGNRLHCTDNLIALPIDIHERVNKVYGSKPPSRAHAQCDFIDKLARLTPAARPGSLASDRHESR